MQLAELKLAFSILQETLNKFAHLNIMCTFALPY